MSPISQADPNQCPSVSGTFAPSSLSLEARLVRAIREALNWSGRTAASAAAVAIPSRAELSQMEDEQITRIKKEGRKEGGNEGAVEGGRRKGGLSGFFWHKWQHCAADRR